MTDIIKWYCFKFELLSHFMKSDNKHHVADKKKHKTKNEMVIYQTHFVPSPDILY